MKPVVRGLEPDYAGKVTFFYLDVDDAANDEFKTALGFSKQPYYALVDGAGEILGTWKGSQSGSTFTEAFDGAIGEAF